MKYAILVLGIVCILAFSNGVTAQVNGMFQDDVNVDIAPENPGPNQLVNVTLSSFSININTSKITWKVNGVQKKSGTGEKSFSFITGGLNTTTRLDIEIKTENGEVLEKTINLKPTGVDLLWQTESLTPPFYKGKPMFSYQNKITFIALPHITNGNGVEIGAKNLVYSWKLNGSVIESAGGYGKNTYTTVGSIISRPLVVQVEVSGTSSGGVGVAEVVVNPVTPEIVLYKKSPLYGIEFQNALVGNVSLQNSQNVGENSKEITVIASPFFFGATGASSPDLSFVWSINGSRINDGGHEVSQVFRQVEDASGISQISLKIENQSKILQYASNGFNLQF